MKSLPASDPRSWRFQANIHGTLDPVTSPLFNQCEHGTTLFLAWHRGYLYYFERILRWASGDPNLNLPYWDWSRHAAVPEPFRVPASAGNPLFEELRALNDGSSIPAEIVVDALNNDLALRAFSTPDDVGFTWSLEGSPHGAVHTVVGGGGGTMSRVATAANDPIFWLHHCNIDRLWDYWLNLGDGRANPSDPAFLDKAYSYADENGRTQTHRVRDILSSGRLGYRYDNVPNPAFTAAVTAAATTSVMMAPQAAAQPSREIPTATSAPAAPQAAPSKPLGLKTETIRLRTLPRAAMAPAEPTGAAPVPALPARPARTLLRINGISFDAVPDFTYGVYLNVPEGQEPSARTRDHLVGTLNFFGKGPSGRAGAHGHGHDGGTEFSQTFDATNVIARLRQKGQWNESAAPRIDLRPLIPVAPRGAQAAVTQRTEASAQEANIRYRSVQLLQSP